MIDINSSIRLIGRQTILSLSLSRSAYFYWFDFHSATEFYCTIFKSPSLGKIGKSSNKNPL